MNASFSFQSALFGNLARELMEPPPPTVDVDTPCHEAVRLLRAHDASCVMVTAAGGHLVGILTAHDVLHRIAFRAEGREVVAEFMSTPVRTVREDDYVLHAMASLRRHDLRHLPVCGQGGKVVGMLHLHQLLELSLPRPLALIDQLTHEATREGLRRVKDGQVTLAEAMLEDGVTAPEVQSLLTQVNNDIYRRIVTRTLTALWDEGWGTPPVEFDVIVMGSGGRGESFLFPDQDNGFILEEYDDARHGAVDAFFIELAERMTKELDAVGIPVCRGNVMATNPLWRKSLPQWKHQLGYWLGRPNAATLRLADIFFDFRAVYGQSRLAEDLRHHLTGQTAHCYRFLHEMQRLQRDHGVAVGPFNRLLVESGPGGGKINLKYHGLLPLVEGIRLLALRERIGSTATLGRIDRLVQQGALCTNERDGLVAAFHTITGLLLRHQLRAYRSGDRVDARVARGVLSRGERDALITSLRAIDTLRRRIHMEFTAEVV